MTVLSTRRRLGTTFIRHRPIGSDGDRPPTTLRCALFDSAPSNPHLTSKVTVPIPSAADALTANPLPVGVQAALRAVLKADAIPPAAIVRLHGNAYVQAFRDEFTAIRTDAESAGWDRAVKALRDTYGVHSVADWLATNKPSYTPREG